MATAEELELRAEYEALLQRVGDLEAAMEQQRCPDCGDAVAPIVAGEHRQGHDRDATSEFIQDQIPQRGAAHADAIQGHVHYARRTMLLMAAGGWGSTKLPSGDPATYNPGADEHDYWYLAFATGADDHAFWNLIMPLNWDGGELTFTPYWMPQTGASSGQTVMWKLYGECYVDGDNLVLNNAFTGEGQSLDTWIGSNLLQIGPESDAFRFQGDAQPGAYTHIIVRRDVSEDNAGSDARLLGCLLSYNTFRFSDFPR